MKLLFFLGFLLFFIFCCTNSAAQEEDTPVPVLDIDGNELKVGIKYYIVPALRGVYGDGRLKPSNYQNEACPITVTQERHDLTPGVPCTFRPSNPEETEIHLDKSVNIKFETPVPSCARSTVWQIGNVDPISQSLLIQMGGVLGATGCTAYASWFRIEKGPDHFPGSYYFIFSPVDVCIIATEVFNLTIPLGMTLSPLGIDFRTTTSPREPFLVRFAAMEGGEEAGNKAYVL